MPRKKWTAKTEITPALLKFREKRRWQIALRRYVIDRNICVDYAPFFGLDIENIRKWFEIQFNSGVGWDDFGEKWQFDHIIPVTYFDFTDENELSLCWNFTNLRLAIHQEQPERGSRVDILGAKAYFKNLYETTSYGPCEKMLKKIEAIELSEIEGAGRQQTFLLENRPYLELIKNYSAFEFELLNRGRSLDEVKREAEFLKKFQ